MIIHALIGPIFTTVKALRVKLSDHLEYYRNSVTGGGGGGGRNDWSVAAHNDIKTTETYHLQGRQKLSYRQSLSSG